MKLLPKKIKIPKLFLILLPITIFTLAVYGVLNIKIDKVICESQLGDCNSAVKELLNGVVNKNFLSAKAQAKNLLENDIQVKSFQINYQLPATLKLNIIERKANYAVSKSDSEIFLVSKDGLVLGKTDKTALPKVTVAGFSQNIGEKVNEEALFALDIVSSISGDFEVIKAKMEDDKLTVEINEYPNVIFPLSGDKKLLLGSLYLITGKFKDNQGGKTLDAKDISIIDLRFKNPVLR